ncbi:MAG: hypothetical protein K2H33_00740, partial [Muribaculaceae bacterium]|nr:hypothetical protein [Muribaculaceae bacterium]
SDILLNEITVTAAKSEEEMHAAMFQALGVKSVDSDYFEEHSITSYEQAIRNIPGLKVVDNVVLPVSSSSIYNTTNVEAWVDGSVWTPFSLSIRSSGGGSLNLNDLESAYPFHIVKKIDYFRPSTAMLISNSAAHGGGALVITTNTGKELKTIDQELFLRVKQPLGYQNKPATYRPYSQYRETIDGTVNTAVWTPITDKVESVDCQSKRAVINGISDTGIPVFIIK